MRPRLLGSMIALIVGAALAFSLVGETPAVSGVPPEPVCRYKPPSPRESSRDELLLETIDRRKGYGFSRDRAFVRRVNADPAARRRGRRLGLPVTVREAAYLRLRDRVQEASGTRLHAYLRRHAASYGGSSLEDDYPRSPYLLFRFTRDLARHRDAIARRLEVRFAVERVRFTERDLERVQDAIDFDDLARQGIHVLLAYPEPGRGVSVEVATARPDARALIRRLYGPAVLVKVVARTPSYLACAAPERFRVAGDGRTVEIAFGHSSSITPQRVEAIETPTEVRLGAVVEIPRGFINSDLRQHRLSVTLAEPIGSRAVKTIPTRKPIRPEPPR